MPNHRPTESRRTVINVPQVLNGIREPFVLWVSTLFHPIQQLSSLTGDHPNSEPLNQLFKIAVSSYTLSLFFYAPLLHMFGIDIGNAGYVISSLLALSLSFTVISICIHLALRVRGQKSEFVKTLAIYNMPIITYYPVTALLSAPATFRFYDALYQVKRQNLPLFQAVSSAFSYIKLHQETNTAIITWLTYLSLVSFISSSIPCICSTPV